MDSVRAGAQCVWYKMFIIFLLKNSVFENDFLVFITPLQFKKSFKKVKDTLFENHL